MIIVITGPTGVGKTKLSIALAKIYNGEIINADSMQVYKGMNIGTAKVTKEEKEGIPHHLLDIKELNEDYNLYQYQIDCRHKIDELKAKKKVPIIVGGTGLYIKAALFDYKLSYEEKKDDDFKDLSNEEIYQKIMLHDSNIQIDKNNRRRLVRCLNKINKDTLLVKEKPKLLYDDVIFIGLTTNTDNLYNIIDKRVDKMLLGLVDEVKELYSKYKDSRALKTAIGYKELIEFFENRISFNEAIELIKKNSRNYAKRQYTFFKNQLNLNWFNVNYSNFDTTINEIVDFIERNKK